MGASGNTAAVAIARCEAYERGEVTRAVRAAIGLLPEIADAITPGLDVLLKVNLTAITPIETAVMTHPLVVEAAGTVFAELGAKVIIGESSGVSGWRMWRTIHRLVFEKLKHKLRGQGYAEIKKLYDRVMSAASLAEILALEAPGIDGPLVTVEEIGPDTDIDFFGSAGMLDAAREIGAGLAYFDLSDVRMLTPQGEGYISTIPMCSPVCDAGRVVSMAKFKTHDCTVLTGAIKNFFGIIPTRVRSTYHVSSSFAGMMPHMLTDVFSVIKPPPFVITDGVVGMEGRGPLEGPPRYLGIIMAATDCVAHDAVMAAIVGLDPMDSPLVKIAYERGLGEARLEHIDVRGEAIEDVARPDWDLWSNNSLRASR